MELSLYQQNVATLLKDPTEIMHSLTSHKINLWHTTSALMGEVAELAGADSYDNAREELGDALFYLEASAIAAKQYPEWEELSSDFSDLSSNRPWDNDIEFAQDISLIGHLAIQAGELFDVVKKHVCYNKPLTSDMVLKFRKHWVALRYLIQQGVEDMPDLSSTLEELRQSNIKKLSKRYPGLQFTDAAAQNRADKGKEYEEGHPVGNDDIGYSTAEGEQDTEHDVGN